MIQKIFYEEMLLYILNLEKCIQYIKFGEIYSIFIEFEEICTINLKEKRSGNPETRTQTKKKKKEKKQHCRKLERYELQYMLNLKTCITTNVELKTYVKIYVEFEDIC